MGSLTKALIGKEDVDVNDNELYPSTFNRLTSTGSTIALTSFPDVWKTHQDAINARSYGTQVGSTLNTAVIIGTTCRDIYLETGEWVISNSYDWSSYKTTRWIFAGGAYLTLDPGVTVTFPSPSNIVAQSSQQIFSGTGTVAFAASGDIYPDWWGAFPNGTNDTATLNSAIAAANTTVAMQGINDSRIVCRAGNVYVTPSGVNAIGCAFFAPQSYFIPTEEVTNTKYILKFKLYEAAGIPKRVDIGAIVGLTAYDAAAHYHNGIVLDTTDDGQFNIGYILNMHYAVVLDSTATNSHIGVNKFNIGTIVGCDYGIYLVGGNGGASISTYACESNQFNVDYISYTGVCVQLYTNAATATAACCANEFNIGTMELHAKDGEQGFVVAGPTTFSNIFRVTRGMSYPRPLGGGLIVNITDSALENIFEVPYMDYDYIASAGGYNIFRLDGKTNSYFPGLYNNNYGRSTVMYSAAPTVYPWRAGDKVWNDSPTDGTTGWVCTVSGTPGTWREFGSQYIDSSTTWDPGAIAAQEYTYKDVTCTGAALGDFAVASFSTSTLLLVVSATVTQANVVTVVLFNPTPTGGAAIDMASSTVYVRAFKL